MVDVIAELIEPQKLEGNCEHKVAPTLVRSGS